MNDNMNRFDVEASSDEKISKKKSKRMDLVALILCLIVAISIWVYVMNLNRSVAEKTITLTVDVSGQIEAATDGMTIISDSNTIDGVSIDYSQLTVKVTVSGMQSVLDKYKDSDYSVKVDVSDIGSSGVYALALNCVTPSDEIEIKSITPSLTGYVLIDKPATRTLTKITAAYEGSFSSEDTISVIPELKSLVISGPASKIEAIDRAEVVVLLAGENKSANKTTSTIRFYDINGMEIKSLGYINIDPSVVNVYVQIETERSFPVIFKNNVVEKDGYRYTASISGDLTSVALYGDTVNMDSVEITVDFSEIDITAKDSGEISADKLKLPENLELRSELEGKTVSYTVTKELIAPQNPEPDISTELPDTTDVAGEGTSSTEAPGTEEIPGTSSPEGTDPSGNDRVPEDGGVA